MRKTRPTYIYVPGLGDGYAWFRHLLLVGWRLRGKRVRHFSSNWNDANESAEAKLERLLWMAKDYEYVVFVGESAGASLALAAVAQRPDTSSFVTVCGYNLGADDLSRRYSACYAAFYDSVRQGESVVRTLPPDVLARSLVLYSEADHVVTPEHTRIEGVRSQKLPSYNHAQAIIYCLLFPGRTVFTWRTGS